MHLLSESTMLCSQFPLEDFFGTKLIKYLSKIKPGGCVIDEQQTDLFCFIMLVMVQ